MAEGLWVGAHWLMETGECFLKCGRQWFGLWPWATELGCPSRAARLDTGTDEWGGRVAKGQPGYQPSGFPSSFVLFPDEASLRRKNSSCLQNLSLISSNNFSLCHIMNQHCQWFCSDYPTEWVHTQLTPWLTQISATYLHNESRTRNRTITIPLYSHQWQTLLINRSCWARRETSHCSVQVPFSVEEIWCRTVEIYSSSLESVILFRLEHFSNDSWGKKKNPSEVSPFKG